MGEEGSDSTRVDQAMDLYAKAATWPVVTEGTVRCRESVWRVELAVRQRHLATHTKLESTTTVALNAANLAQLYTSSTPKANNITSSHAADDGADPETLSSARIDHVEIEAAGDKRRFLRYYSSPDNLAHSLEVTHLLDYVYGEDVEFAGHAWSPDALHYAFVAEQKQPRQDHWCKDREHPQPKPTSQAEQAAHSTFLARENWGEGRAKVMAPVLFLFDCVTGRLSTATLPAGVLPGQPLFLNSTQLAMVAWSNTAPRPPGILYCANRESRPHSAVSCGFTPLLSALVAVGYGILLPNYRGSLGNGTAAVASLVGKIGQQDVADTMACLDEVQAAEAWAASLPVHVFGGSHGGFLTAHLSGRFPQRFQSATLRNPVIDVASMICATDIPDWCLVECGIPESTLVCNMTTAQWEMLRQASPLQYAGAASASAVQSAPMDFKTAGYEADDQTAGAYSSMPAPTFGAKGGPQKKKMAKKAPPKKEPAQKKAPSKAKMFSKSAASFASDDEGDDDFNLSGLSAKSKTKTKTAQSATKTQSAYDRFVTATLRQRESDAS
ncbi:uncharacterized protein MONBRDRAFT_10456 [Monosiga brevicollis MX1]|uniref:acylaminoacyl-peptidase n=1 Tax=Monosiga brevicollis TaxID=81824 RepID=A9V692_MONBE|nr:uncharacterized protein MONBRDRAFT_10456 [Monosiga brevicollis MX1]EDQ86950.1 predicted protein [Monosiga brevicollis MX1]|eukprot:XP_001748189.1 hypothetical protein [Monosiga brevicollis MX1]